MTAWLLLAAALLQHPFGEPPVAVLGSAPEPECLGGEWRLLGPVTPARERNAGLLSRAQLAGMQPGAPWPALDEPFADAGGLRLLWRDADVGRIARAQAARFPHPREIVGIESGRVLLTEFPQLDASDAPRAALLYRPVYAREATALAVQLLGGGAARLWVNGRLAAELPEGAALPVVQGIQLAKGLNHLLFETAAPAAGPWWIELRQRHPLTQPAIDRAIDAGMRWLLARQYADGSWPGWAGYPSGTTALALLALLKSGLPASHPSARRAIEAMRRDPPQHTYSTAIALMALQAAGDRAHDDWMRDMAHDLIAWQEGNGLWGYPGGGGGDLSNTQFAALGLRAAEQRGIEVPRATWRELRDATMSCRPGGRRGVGTGENGRSGFGYFFDSGSTLSMTAAGVATLLICGEGMDEPLDRRVRAAVEDGLDWLGRNCPHHGFLSSGDSWTLYMLYGLERAGAIARVETFADHAWYPEGAAWLLERQGANGGWLGRAESVVDTSFALLFLTRATSKAAVTQPGGDQGAGRLFVSSPDDGPLVLRAALRETLDLWVDSGSPDFASYARVVYSVRPPGGEWRPVAGGATKRFDARVALDEPGVWQARATAFCHDGRAVGSGTIEVGWLIAPAAPVPGDGAEYPPDANLLQAGACRAEASSMAPNGGPAGACDGRPETRWMCAEDDRTPWLELRPRRRVAGGVLVLRAVSWLPSDDESEPQPARIRVTVNGGEPILAELADRWPPAWIVDLGGTAAVESLRIEILEARRGRLGACSVGFGEVEIHAGAQGGR